MRARRAAALGAVVAMLVAVPIGCGDDQPAFCGPFAEASDLDELTDALGAGDLDLARAEARRLDDLADQAPADIRADLAALTAAVVDVIDLLDSGEPPGRGSDALNRRLAELDRRSAAVEDWALQNCGIELR